MARKKFKMAGFSPYTKASSSPMRILSPAQKYVLKRRTEQFRDLFRPVGKKKALPIGGDKARLRRARKEKELRERSYGERSIEHMHSVRPSEVATGSSLSEDEQRRIQRTIQRQGNFGDIPSNLLKGYQKGTDAYRRRVAEINAHHDFLVNSNPYNRKEQRANLHQKLSMLKPGNWENRYSDFPGHNTYDEYGNPRYPEDRRRRTAYTKRENTNNSKKKQFGRSTGIKLPPNSTTGRMLF